MGTDGPWIESVFIGEICGQPQGFEIVGAPFEIAARIVGDENQGEISGFNPSATDYTDGHKWAFDCIRVYP